jgi:hypothetical protein
VATYLTRTRATDRYETKARAPEARGKATTGIEPVPAASPDVAGVDSFVPSDFAAQVLLYAEHFRGSASR